jgi:hypothetical protein
MTKFIPSVILCVYATVVLALGAAGTALGVLGLGVLVLIVDKVLEAMNGNDEVWQSIRLIRASHEALAGSLNELREETARINSAVIEMKGRIGSMASDLSKVNKSDDPWSNNE